MRVPTWQPVATTVRFTAASDRFDRSAEGRLRKLAAELKQVAGPDTAYDGRIYEQRKKQCPLTGHCNGVSRLVRKLFGGELVRARIEVRQDGEVIQETHIWNRLPDGREYDLTSGQFGGDGLHPMDSPKNAAAGAKVSRKGVLPERKSVNPRFKKLEQRWEALRQQ